MSTGSSEPRYPCRRRIGLGTTADAPVTGLLVRPGWRPDDPVASEPERRRTRAMDATQTIEHLDTIVVGAGQAGLSAGYHLAKRGLPFAILDADARIGDHWRDRWERCACTAPLATTRSRACASPRRRPTGRRRARWPTTWRHTPDGSTCPSGVGRASIGSNRWVAASSFRPPMVGASPPGTSSSRPGRSGSPSCRRSRRSSTRRSGRCTRTSTATRAS